MISLDEVVDDDDDDDDEDKEKGYVAPSALISKILFGDIDIELPSQVQIVRIFTSSTFTGTNYICVCKESLETYFEFTTLLRP